MGQLMDAIFARRSIRRYEPKEIPEEVLAQLLEAIRWSPSWANTQCWEVVVVRDPQRKQALQETLSKTNPAAKAMVQAPLVLVMCGRLKDSGFYKGEMSTKLGDWFMYDLGIATQSLCLAAHDLGLGTVVVGLFDQDQVAKVIAAPPGVEVVSMVPVGYPAKISGAPKRREVAEFTKYETF